MKIERLKRMAMSTKIHYSGYPRCGYAYSNHARRTFCIDDITCKSCLKNLLRQKEKDLAELQEEHKEVEHRCKQLFIIPW